MWLILMGRCLDISAYLLLDISDNEVTTCSLAHGRSPSPTLNPLLRKRAALELV